jgi:glycosyltransferase involved in cell wall biosynthesis
MIDLSVVIPNRNSPFTANTINDALNNAGCSVEVIVNVDENWPNPIVEDERVHYIHPPSPVGLRRGINSAVAMARGKYILKADDHIAFAPGFGKTLIEAHREPNWVQIPRRYALDAENWKIEEQDNDKYPIDYMYIDFPRKGKDHDDGMHGVPWRERRDARLVNTGLEYFDIDETPSMQGSCYFMLKDYFDNFLHGLSEEGYGQFAQEAQEIGFKTWLGGGAVMVNKLTWYAHLHKGNKYGRFYSFPGGTKEASEWSAEHWLNNREPGMVHDFDWFINEKFPNMPSWPENWKDELANMGWFGQNFAKGNT